jgi:hypothetical protein
MSISSNWVSWRVEKEQLRGLGKAAGKGDALALAAGNLVGFALGEFLHARQAQHLVNAGANLVLGHRRATQAEGDVVPDG